MPDLKLALEFNKIIAETAIAANALLGPAADPGLAERLNRTLLNPDFVACTVDHYDAAASGMQRLEVLGNQLGETTTSPGVLMDRIENGMDRIFQGANPDDIAPIPGVAPELSSAFFGTVAATYQNLEQTASMCEKIANPPTPASKPPVPGGM